MKHPPASVPVILALALVSIGPVRADDRTISTSLLLGGSAALSPKSFSQHQDPGYAAGIRAQYPLTDYMAIGGTYQRLSMAGAGSRSRCVFQPVTAELFFQVPKLSVTPYFLMGVGPSWNRYTFRSGEKRWMSMHGKFGLGAEYDLSPVWFLGVEGDLFLISPSGTENDFLIPATLQAFVGYRWDLPYFTPKAKTIIPPATPPLPEAPQPISQTAPVTTPPAAPARTVEQEVQSDLDRVMLQVRNQRMRPIHFETARAVINPKSAPTINEVGKILAKHRELKVIVEGHTDSVGVARSNQILSQNRANAVRGYLIREWNLDPNKVEAIGYGDTRPIADNAIEAGRTLNRRVEFKIAR